MDESTFGLGFSGFLSDGRVLVGDLELVFDAEVLLVNGIGKILSLIGLELLGIKVNICPIKVRLSLV